MQCSDAILNDENFEIHFTVYRIYVTLYAHSLHTLSKCHSRCKQMLLFKVKTYSVQVTKQYLTFLLQKQVKKVNINKVNT